MASTDSSSKAKDYLLVVAIDFGTCLSGYAYSNVKRENEKVDIYHHHCWTSNREHMKTATCILFDKNQEFVSFGFDAQKKFSELQEEGQQSDFYYFEYFKMNLYTKKGSLNNLELEDIQGKNMPAITVFAQSIKALKDKVLQRLKDVEKPAKVSEIRWVLTVPAIWQDDSKLFMRKCAQEAGIPTEKLLIALEPEAASIYCQLIRLIVGMESQDGFVETQHGTKYCVVDVGGGTTDITIHEKKTNGELKELRTPEGQNVGGLEVELRFLHWLESILGRDLLQKLKKFKPSSYQEIQKALEKVKKDLMPGENEMLSVTIPRYDLEELLRLSFPEDYTLDIHVKKCRMDTKLNKTDNISIKGQTLRIHSEEMKNEMKPIIENILKLIRRAVAGHEISLIILVGGFAESELLKAKVKESFKNITVLVPEHASLAVLKGAVMYGHYPEYINPRKTRCTYGVDTWALFDKSIHDDKRKRKDGWGNERCIDCFYHIIGINESVPLGKTVKKRFYTTTKYQNLMSFDVYATLEEKTIYVDVKCWPIGTFQVTLTAPSSLTREVEVEFIFWDTELKIKAKDVMYEKEIEATIKFI